MSKRKLKEGRSTKARVFRANQYCKNLDKAVVKAVKESEKPRHPVKRKLTIPKHTEDTTTKKKKSSDKGNKWARQAAVKVRTSTLMTMPTTWQSTRGSRGSRRR
ncbi:hypothetical protein FALCPG4_012820 [Fusarium falciforme]